MKNTKLTALILTGIITASITFPSIQASAQTFNTVSSNDFVHRNLSPQELDELNDWMNSLKNDFKNEKQKNVIQPRGPGSLIVLKAGQWLMKNWPKVVAKAPTWLKPYLKFSFAGKVIGKYMEISTTIDHLVWGILRDLIPRWIPDPIVGGLKNVIVTIIPL
ncbi:hypothetical protein K5V21_16060 [Clostridium sardiniense]|uniref:Uncharacterized protein n=1 Tax=Clostridium sardiniense TaxID=29369 RepID=A0ABS7L1N7_CLOSR|nr:hypothetical protein [Clostridium sardiniense]MBY0756936.1 hypothetical protein [Clostridium sardiniense]MBY0756960.1 hypothetical protein [Clostridium sardiniense]MDQ0460354.1 hypothetical protein [Clostridium sardiniense]